MSISASSSRPLGRTQALIDLPGSSRTLQHIIDDARQSLRDRVLGLSWEWVRHPLTTLSSAAIASVLCGLVLHPRCFVLTAGLFAVLTMGIFWPWISTRGLVGEIWISARRGREGRPLAVRLWLRNRLPWYVFGVEICSRPKRNSGNRGLVSRAESRASYDHLPRIGPWRLELEREWTPTHRGEFPGRGEVPRCESGFPFGLWWSGRPLKLRASCLIWPSVVEVPALPVNLVGDASEGDSRAGPISSHGELAGVRPYRRGDSLRQAHWPQTARHGHLIIRELRSSSVPHVQIVLDSHSNSHRGSGPDSSWEWAIRLAASFVEAWSDQGAEVELVTTSDTEAGKRLTRDGKTQAMDALARLSLGSQPIDQLLASPACRKFKSGLRLVISTDHAQLARPLDSPSVQQKWIVLRADGFSGLDQDEDQDHEPPPATWLWVTDPERARRGWRTTSQFLEPWRATHEQAF